jgi:hypothetical protein
MKTKTKFLSILMLVGVVSISACKKDDDNPETPTPNPTGGETELITNVTLFFIDTTSFDITSAEFSDPDGQGGNAPTITPINLLTNGNYICLINVLDASNPSEVDTITIEINEEAADHQFFYAPSNLSPASVNTNYKDFDENGKPLGLQSQWITGPEVSPSNATMKIVLRHQPNKSGANVSNGDITNAGGETDVEIDFPIIIAE